VNLENVTREDWTIAVLALLLALDLLFVPWFSVSVSVGSLIFSASSTAVQAPDGWLGVIAVLASLAVIADLAIERLSPRTGLPVLGGSRASTRFALAVVAAVCVALKFLLHVHFTYFAFGFYAAVVLAAALVYVTLRVWQGRPLRTARGGRGTPTGAGP
jgi:hypothetical protein